MITIENETCVSMISLQHLAIDQRPFVLNHTLSCYGWPGIVARLLSLSILRMPA